MIGDWRLGSLDRMDHAPFAQTTASVAGNGPICASGDQSQTVAENESEASLKTASN